MYMEGKGLPEPDYKNAIYWLTKASNNCDNQFKGQPESDLGLIYFNGLGMSKPNYKQAIYWFNRSITHDFKWPVMYLASIYEHVLPYRDLAMAFSYYLKGADLPSSYCIRKVSYMYKNGIGISKNIQEANKWYNKISENKKMARNFKSLNIGDELMWSALDGDNEDVTDLLKLDKIGIVNDE